MKTPNEFKKEVIGELEDKVKKLENEVKVFEEFGENHKNKLAELSAEWDAIAVTIEEINEIKARYKASLLRIAGSNTEMIKQIEAMEKLKEEEPIRWSFDEEIQKVYTLIFLVEKSLRKWKGMSSKEIADSGEFNAMNDSIID